MKAFKDELAELDAKHEEDKTKLHTEHALALAKIDDDTRDKIGGGHTLDDVKADRQQKRRDAKGTYKAKVNDLVERFNKSRAALFEKHDLEDQPTA